MLEILKHLELWKGELMVKNTREITKDRSVENKSHSAQVIGFMSGKGGAGKTSLALNVAKFCADNESKILFIDCDANTNGATMFFLTDEWKNIRRKLNNAFCFKDFLDSLLNDIELNNNNHKFPEVITITNNFDFIPANIYGRVFNEKDISQIFKIKLEETLETCLASWRKQYDLIMLDFGGGEMIINSILANIVDNICIVMEPNLISHQAVQLKLNFLITPQAHEKIVLCYNRLQGKQNNAVSKFSIIKEFNGFCSSTKFAEQFETGKFIEMSDKELTSQLINIVKNICSDEKILTNYEKKIEEQKAVCQERRKKEIEEERKQHEKKIAQLTQITTLSIIILILCGITIYILVEKNQWQNVRFWIYTLIGAVLSMLLILGIIKKTRLLNNAVKYVYEKIFEEMPEVFDEYEDDNEYME